MTRGWSIATRLIVVIVFLCLTTVQDPARALAPKSRFEQRGSALTLKQKLAAAIRKIQDEKPGLTTPDRGELHPLANEVSRSYPELYQELTSRIGGDPYDIAYYVENFAATILKQAANRQRYTFTNPEVLDDLLHELKSEPGQRWIIAIDGEPLSGKTRFSMAIGNKDSILGELLEEMEFVEGERGLSDWYRAVMEDPDLPFGIRAGTQTDQAILDTWASKMAKKHIRYYVRVVGRRVGASERVKNIIRMMFGVPRGRLEYFQMEYLKGVEDRIAVYVANGSHHLVDNVLAKNSEFPFTRLAKVKIIRNPDETRSLDVQYLTAGVQPSASAAPKAEGAEKALANSPSLEEKISEGEFYDEVMRRAQEHKVLMPFVIGMGGDGGVVEESFGEKLKNELENRGRKVLVLNMGDFLVHPMFRQGLSEAGKVWGPEHVLVSELRKVLTSVNEGEKSVEVSRYALKSGTEEENWNPPMERITIPLEKYDTVIVCSPWALSSRKDLGGMAGFVNLPIYMEAPAKSLYHWKWQQEQGRVPCGVSRGVFRKYWLRGLLPDLKRNVAPTKVHADFVVKADSDGALQFQYGPWAPMPTVSEAEAQTETDPSHLIYLDGKEFRQPGEIISRLNHIYYGLEGENIYRDFKTTTYLDDQAALADAREFYEMLSSREAVSNLPQTIWVHHWGIGNGKFTAEFLDHFKALDVENRFYPRLRVIVGDSSAASLKAARTSPDLMKHNANLAFVQFDANKSLPFKDQKALLIRFNELYDDLGNVEKIIKVNDDTFYRVRGRLWILPHQTFRKKDGRSISAQVFVRDYWNKGMEALNQLDISFLDGIGWEEVLEDSPIDLAKHPYGSFMKEWTKGEKQGLFVMNLGAAENLRQAVDMLDLEHGGFLRLSDYGFMTKKAIRLGKKKPSGMLWRTSGRQPTAWVNCALLKEALKDRPDVAVSIEEEDRHVSRMIGKTMRNKKTLSSIMQYSDEVKIPFNVMRLMSKNLEAIPGQRVEKEELIRAMLEHSRDAMVALGYDNAEAAVKQFVDHLFDIAAPDEVNFSFYHLKVCSAQLGTTARGNGLPAAQASAVSLTSERSQSDTALFTMLNGVLRDSMPLVNASLVAVVMKEHPNKDASFVERLYDVIQQNSGASPDAKLREFNRLYPGDPIEEISALAVQANALKKTLSKPVALASAGRNLLELFQSDLAYTISVDDPADIKEVMGSNPSLLEAQSLLVDTLGNTQEAGYEKFSHVERVLQEHPDVKNLFLVFDAEREISQSRKIADQLSKQGKRVHVIGMAYPMPSATAKKALRIALKHIGYTGSVDVDQLKIANQSFRSLSSALKRVGADTVLSGVSGDLAEIKALHDMGAGTASVLAAKNCVKGSPGSLLAWWCGDENVKLRESSFTVKELENLRDFSSSTIRKELAILLKLGLVYRYKDKREYRYELSEIARRAPPEFIEKIADLKLLKRFEISDEQIEQARGEIEEILVSPSNQERAIADQFQNAIKKTNPVDKEVPPADTVLVYPGSGKDIATVLNHLTMDTSVSDIFIVDPIYKNQGTRNALLDMLKNKTGCDANPVKVEGAHDGWHCVQFGYGGAVRRLHIIAGKGEQFIVPREIGNKRVITLKGWVPYLPADTIAFYTNGLTRMKRGDQLRISGVGLPMVYFPWSVLGLVEMETGPLGLKQGKIAGQDGHTSVEGNEWVVFEKTADMPSQEIYAWIGINIALRDMYQIVNAIRREQRKVKIKDQQYWQQILWRELLQFEVYKGRLDSMLRLIPKEEKSRTFQKVLDVLRSWHEGFFSDGLGKGQKGDLVYRLMSSVAAMLRKQYMAANQMPAPKREPEVTMSEEVFYDEVAKRADENKTKIPFMIGLGGSEGVMKSEATDRLKTELEKKGRKVLVLDMADYLVHPAYRLGLVRAAEQWHQTQGMKDHVDMEGFIKALKAFWAGEKEVRLQRLVKTPGTEEDPLDFMEVYQTVPAGMYDTVIVKSDWALTEMGDIDNFVSFMNLSIFVDGRKKDLYQWRWEEERGKAPFGSSEEVFKKYWKQCLLPDLDENVIPSKANAEFVITVGSDRNRTFKYGPQLVLHSNPVSLARADDDKWIYLDGKEFRQPGETYRRINGIYYELKGKDIYGDYSTSVKRDDVIAKADAAEFYETLLLADDMRGLPESIVVHHWGIGDGTHAADFLDHFKHLDTGDKYYHRLKFVLGDFSSAMIEAARQNENLMRHKAILSFVQFDANEELPFKKGQAMLVRFNELYDDLGGLEKVIKVDNDTFYRVASRLRVPRGHQFRLKDGAVISAEMFAKDYWAKGITALRQLDDSFLKCRISLN